MPATSSSNSWLSRQTPERKKQLMILAMFAVAGVLGYVFFAGTSMPEARKPKKAISNILTGADTREMGLTGVAKDVDELQRQVKTLQDQQQHTTSTATDGEKTKEIESLREQVDILARRVEAQGTEPRPSMPSLPTGTNGPAGPTTGPAGTVWNGNPPNGAPNGASSAPAKPTRIYEIDSDADAGAAAKGRSGAVDARTAKAQANKVPKLYLPRGAMMQGVTLTGLDAPTGRGSTQDPIPVLVRIKHEAILPNRFHADYRECFALLSGYGDLSSERAYLRSTGLSCVRADGKVIDTNIEMVAIGEDGKAGLRGRFVSKQGQAIAKAAIAGFAQSYAQSLRPNGGYNVGGVAGGALNGDQVENGFYGGASSALDRVAKFYIDYANQMFPVVEVDAGRPVTLVVVRGTELQVASN